MVYRDGFYIPVRVYHCFLKPFVYIKMLIESMNNPLGVSPSKGNQGTTRGKEKIF